MEALEKEKMWEIMKMPQNKRGVGCKWVFAMKHKLDGFVKRNKTRLVSKEHTQTFEVDFQEIFAQVAKLNTIRILISCKLQLRFRPCLD